MQENEQSCLRPYAWPLQKRSKADAEVGVGDRATVWQPNGS
jgi:hypothetical protein